MFLCFYVSIFMFSVFSIFLSERLFIFFESFFICLFGCSLVTREQLLHSGAEEGRLRKTIRLLEDFETLGIDRSVGLVEVPLRDPRPTEGVSQSVRDSRLETRAENLDLVEEVRFVVGVCPDQVRLGVLGMVFPHVFRLLVALDLLRALESERREDGLLELLGVGHLESVCRLVGLPRVDYRLVNFLLVSGYSWLSNDA